MSDPRTMASQIIDAALIETRTWSTDEVRQMMNEAVDAEREVCAQMADAAGECALADEIRARGKVSIP